MFRMESKHLLCLEVGRSTISSKFDRTRQGEKAWKYPKIVEKIERLGAIVRMSILRMKSVTVHRSATHAMWRVQRCMYPTATHCSRAFVVPDPFQIVSRPCSTATIRLALSLRNACLAAMLCESVPKSSWNQDPATCCFSRPCPGLAQVIRIQLEHHRKIKCSL